MTSWDLLTARDDVRRIEVRTGPTAEPADGEVLLEVERFALTTNNITYGVLGDSLGYWRFFPAPAGWGRIPAWGFARVVGSRVPGVAEGLRVYGYLPMSTHVVMRLAPAARRPEVFVDRAAHRADLSPIYNSYLAAPLDPFDNHRAVLQPLVSTSFLLDDELTRSASPRTVVLSSASSKTAMGLAWLLRRRGVAVVGLTSADKVSSLGAHGLYDVLVSYDELALPGLEAPVAFVDFAGDPSVVAMVHRRLADALSRSVLVGATHRDTSPDHSGLAGPTPQWFAPERAGAMAERVGGAALLHQLDAATRGFAAASPWLRIVEHVGPDALQQIYGTVVTGRALPSDGHVVRP